MRNDFFSKNLCAGAFAALLLLASPGAPLAHAASHRANAQLLASELPAGVTLSGASTKQMKAAVGSAAAKRPADAADIAGIAILAKTPKRRAISCDVVRAIVDAAIEAAPDRSRAIAEMAESLAPDCAQVIDGIVRNATAGRNGTTGGAAVPGSTAGEAGGEGTAGGDFGGGFGPGFPGSPTFGGSSPSGGFALPPTTQPPVTTDSNG